MTKSLVAMWVGIGLLVLSWLSPPWLEVSTRGIIQVGFSSIFVIHEFRIQPPAYVVDFPRLMLLDLSFIAVTAGAMITFRKSSV